MKRSAKRRRDIPATMAGDREIAAATADIGGRAEMEDEHLLEVESVRPLRVLGGVFDGHGGVSVARLAKVRFGPLFRASLPSGPESAFRAGYAALQRESGGMDGGAVAATFWIDGPRVTVANAGDAHIVSVAGDRAARLTEDHRITNEAELKRVVDAGATIWGPYVCLPDGRGIMPTRALGDHEFTKVGVLSDPVVSTHALEPGFLIAACDGLWDVMETEELPGVLAGITGAQEAAERLRREALEVRKTSDNLTVLAVRLGPSP
jgi:serine/threonine protein phosphatase PrpC